jgi:hypothetical protein
LAVARCVRVNDRDAVAVFVSSANFSFHCRSSFFPS